VYGDENRFEQILLNFVSNALKFSDEASTVKVQLSGSLLSEEESKYYAKDKD